MKLIYLTAIMILASTPLWPSEDGIIISYKTTDQSLIEALENQYELTRIKFIEPINAGLYRSMWDTDWVLLQVSAERIVAYAEKNHPIQINSTFKGTIEDQWYLENENTGNIDINWLASQDYLSKHRDHSESVIVAIIDDGLFWEEISVDGTTPYDASNLAYNSSEPFDGVDNDGNGKVDDYLGWDFADADNIVIPASEANNHGTNIAYLIQSNLNTFTSICKGAKIKILPLKAGFDYSDTLSLFACVEALYYAQEMGASIINCSWGSSQNSYLLKSALDNLEDANVLVVAASGNGGSDGLGIDTDAYSHYPSGYTNSNILSVAAINREGNLADFSNYGATTVDIAAPGEAVKTISAINERLWGVDVSGTSFATPIVTAVASLLKSLNTELAPSEIKAILTKTAAKRPDALGGNGLWDLGEAFADINGNGIYDTAEPFEDLPKVASAGILDSYQALYAVYNMGTIYRSNDLDNWQFEEDRLALFDYSGVHNPHTIDQWKIDIAVQSIEGLTLALFGWVNDGWESFSTEYIGSVGSNSGSEPPSKNPIEAEYFKIVGFN